VIRAFHFLPLARLREDSPAPALILALNRLAGRWPGLDRAALVLEQFI
jgi:hypothetical protein